MFTLALVIGIYSYSIYFLGLLGLLYSPLVLLWTITFLLGLVYYYRAPLAQIMKSLTLPKIQRSNLFLVFLVFLLSLQILVNFLGALGPELSFDALWYHLTLPKLYLLHHTIMHIPGGLLYYSDMPKLIEMIYTGVLSFGLPFLPKVIHLLFGILTLFALYKFSRLWYSQLLSLFAVIIFYSNLVVGWESITAYIDLGLTFFEVMAVWALFLWMKEKSQKWFFLSALMLGFALTTKLLALWSILGIIILLFLIEYKQHVAWKNIVKHIGTYVGIVFLIPLPWFIFALIHTGNPMYPLFSSVLQEKSNILQLFNPFYFITSFWTLFMHSSDPISPWYMMVLPVVIFLYKKAPFSVKLLYWYSAVALFFWYITPQVGGGRFILPFLPVFSLVSIFPLAFYQKQKLVFPLASLMIVILAVVSIGYRGLANWKYMPVILQQESTSAFLTRNLHFSFGDFYDTDGYFKTHIKPTDTVLLYGFHNLYYVDFPFVDSSWASRGVSFNYIAVQNEALPKRFRYWNVVYMNPVTHVTLYKAGGIPWVY